MRLSCLTNSYGRFGPEAAIRLLPEAGIRFIELPIKNAGVASFFGEIPLLTNAAGTAELDRVHDLLAEQGMRLSSCNISSGNIRDDDAVERTLVKLALAEQLGVQLVVGGGGEARDAAEAERLHSQLRRSGDAAGERGIVYCCETHPGSCQNAEAMQRTMEAVDHPHIRLNFDTGNLYYYNHRVDLLAALEQVLPWVEHVHLKDTPGGYEEWNFRELGNGVVDFWEVGQRLRSSQFRGPCSLELEGLRGEPPPTLEEHQARILRSVEHLRQCGWSNVAS
ncbi:MAG: sugar phosphate isomerase/epimerase [Planctomycetaceae bacterium]